MFSNLYNVWWSSIRRNIEDRMLDLSNALTGLSGNIVQFYSIFIIFKAKQYVSLLGIKLMSLTVHKFMVFRFANCGKNVKVVWPKFHVCIVNPRSNYSAAKVIKIDEILVLHNSQHLTAVSPGSWWYLYHLYLTIYNI